MSEILLQMEHISKSFAGVQALKDVQFCCRKGEVMVLAGENGAGKSTILKILLGIHQADAGTITLKGQKVVIKNPAQAQKLGIAMVFQELTLVSEMTVAENLYLNMEPVNKWGLIDKKAMESKINEAMERYNIRIDMHALVGSLSVAEQQMAEILKILLTDPELIILDEPTSALARKEVDKLHEIITELLKNGKTIVFISHRLEEVFRIGNRVTVFKDGTYIGEQPLADMTQDDLIKMMVGRPLQNIFPLKENDVTDEVLFEVKHLQGKGIHDIGFSVHRGEILGVAGLQGHGQNELLDAIGGLHAITHGEIWLNGKEIKVKNAGQAIAQGIALVPSDRKQEGLMTNLSIRHNMAVASMKKRRKAFFIDAKKETSFALDTAKQLAIKTASIENEVSSLSGGNQQKVVLGKELAIEPHVILFNEPTRGIDVEAKREFYTIMHRLAASGVAVVMCSSDLMEVIGMSDRVVVLYEGKVTSILLKNQLTEENIMRCAMGLSHKDEEGAR